MTRLIFGQDEKLAAWAAQRIDTVGEAGFGPCRAVGIADGEGRKLLAVVVYSGVSHGTIQISAAASSPRWASRGNIRALLAYPFEQLGLRKAWMGIAHDNARSLRFNLGIGFRKEATLRHQFGPNRHAVIVSMMRNEWEKRWGGEHDGSR